jgi:hypothetical protein
VPVRTEFTTVAYNMQNAEELYSVPKPQSSSILDGEVIELTDSDFSDTELQEVVQSRTRLKDKSTRNSPPAHYIGVRTSSVTGDLQQPATSPIQDGESLNVGSARMKASSGQSRSDAIQPTHTYANTPAFADQSVENPSCSNGWTLAEMLDAVVEVVPDVEPVYATQLIEKYLRTKDRKTVLESTLHDILEDISYPRKDRKGKRKLTDCPREDSAKKQKSETVDYADNNRVFTGGAHYHDLALVRIMA